MSLDLRKHNKGRKKKFGCKDEVNIHIRGEIAKRFIEYCKSNSKFKSGFASEIIKKYLDALENSKGTGGKDGTK